MAAYPPQKIRSNELLEVYPSYISEQEKQEIESTLECVLDMQAQIAVKLAEQGESIDLVEANYEDTVAHNDAGIDEYAEALKKSGNYRIKGSAVGTVAGGAIGAVFGPVGVPIGAAIGAAAGNFVGKGLKGIVHGNIDAETEALRQRQKEYKMPAAPVAEPTPTFENAEKGGSDPDDVPVWGEPAPRVSFSPDDEAFLEKVFSMCLQVDERQRAISTVLAEQGYQVRHSVMMGSQVEDQQKAFKRVDRAGSLFRSVLNVFGGRDAALPATPTDTVEALRRLCQGDFKPVAEAEELWEYQRWYLTTWSDTMPLEAKWTSVATNKARTKEEVEASLPDDWTWKGGWRCSQEWEYGGSFGSYHPAPARALDVLRRRKWKRTRVLREPAPEDKILFVLQQVKESSRVQRDEIVAQNRFLDELAGKTLENIDQSKQNSKRVKQKLDAFL